MIKFGVQLCAHFLGFLEVQVKVKVKVKVKEVVNVVQRVGTTFKKEN